MPFWPHFLGGLVERHPGFWRWLGNLETASLASRLHETAVSMPIYVCGLARSGSTLLHELIASHPAVATHRIKDYPLVFTPYWWRRATAKVPPAAPRERAHRDGIMITPESPDALEEMIWMAFFPDCHNPAKNNVLGRPDTNLSFDAFYKTHLGKLLLAEGKPRYAAKANYHVARLAYLVRLFPDARFIIPVREPVDHIASLARQHEWFSSGQRSCLRALAYLQRSGHFEFGLDRRPMNLGNGEHVRQITDAWDSGAEVRGLAMYWSMVYEYLARLLESDDEVRQASLVVRFEDVCLAPAETFGRVFEHCRLENAAEISHRRAADVRKPTHQNRLTTDELSTIRQETAATASLWGY
ncbi:MAG: sulfotransferase family protein [Pirellulales bacterium]